MGNLESKSLKELRDDVRGLVKEHGLKGRTKNGQEGNNQINFWDKADCISYIYSVMQSPEYKGDKEHEEERRIVKEGKKQEDRAREQKRKDNEKKKEEWQNEEGEGEKQHSDKPEEYNKKEESNESELLKALVNSLDGKLKAKSLDSKQIEKLIDDKLKGIVKPLQIEITEQGKEPRKLEGLSHKLLPTLIKLAEQRVHTFLVGEAGSGKTTACRQVAEALGLDFEYTAFNSQSTKADLYGFIDANGNYRETSFYRMYSNGGVWLADEMDASNPNILASLNSALDNGFASFPCGMVKANDNFICFSAGNTYGKGKNRQYVGRNELDGATLDRFYTIDFDYDDSLEFLIAGNDNWVKDIQAIRKAIYELGERIICSPRASYKGAKLLMAGFKKSELYDSLIFRGTNEETKKRIMAKAGL